MNEEINTTAVAHNPLQLSPEEQRVLGSLIEKSIVTPDNYPLSLNSLMLACNQKTARNPVVDYDEQSVGIFVDSLKKIYLVGIVTGAGSRVAKYRHCFLSRYEQVDQPGLAIIGLLLLRGPLTPGEIKSASGRMFEFSTLEEVHASIDRLRLLDPPLVVLMPRQPGQKEARYTHTFAPIPEFSAEAETAVNTPSSYAMQLEQRIQVLEEQVKKLEESVIHLQKLWE